MELDDLKQTWKETTGKIKPSQKNIMELIQNKDHGPVAQLKRRFRRRLVAIPLVLSVLIFDLSRHHDIFSDLLFWLYVFICIMLTGYFYMNYRLLGNMQRMDGQVRATLERQVRILEKGVIWRLVIVRSLFIVFIVLLEVLLYYRQEPSLVKWYAQPLGIRLASYAILWLSFYFFSGFVIQHEYKKHILYLKGLVEQVR
jgi:hypothetical protein